MLSEYVSKHKNDFILKKENIIIVGTGRWVKA